MTTDGPPGDVRDHGGGRSDGGDLPGRARRSDPADRSSPDRPPRHVLVVTDGSDDSVHACRTVGELLPDADVEILAAVTVDRSVYEGTTGFAGPVVSDDELTEIERARNVEAMGAAAATARALGDRPAHQTIVAAEPVDAVLEVMDRTHPDLVVVASTARGTTTAAGGPIADDLLDRLDGPLLVVPPEPSAKEAAERASFGEQR